MTPAVPQVVAHRGASDKIAEHTLGAYLAAVDEGADGFECDVRLTADGHLVCVHDRTLRRIAGRRDVISTMELAELAALDVASWKNPWSDLDDEAPLREEEDGKVLTLRRLLGDRRRARPTARGGHRDEAPHPLRRPRREAGSSSCCATSAGTAPARPCAS